MTNLSSSENWRYEISFYRTNRHDKNSGSPRKEVYDKVNSGVPGQNGICLTLYFDWEPGTLAKANHSLGSKALSEAKSRIEEGCVFSSFSSQSRSAF